MLCPSDVCPCRQEKSRSRADLASESPSELCCRHKFPIADFWPRRSLPHCSPRTVCRGVCVILTMPVLEIARCPAEFVHATRLAETFRILPSADHDLFSNTSSITRSISVGLANLNREPRRSAKRNARGSGLGFQRRCRQHCEMRRRGWVCQSTERSRDTTRPRQTTRAHLEFLRRCIAQFVITSLNSDYLSM